jgi:hypothetical protein
MPTFIKALRDRVKALEPALGDVFISEAGSEADFPYCILDLLWEDDNLNSEEDERYKEVRIQFTFFGHTAEQANTIGRKVRKGLMPKSGNPPLIFEGYLGEDEYEMTRWPERFKGPSEEAESRLDGGKVWRTMFDYTWLIGVNDV